MLAAYQNLAGVFMERKRYDLAEDNYKTAIKLSPKDPNLYFNWPSRIRNKSNIRRPKILI